MEQQTGEPILPEGLSREPGREAQGANIAAAKAVARAIRTTLGPQGMDKMLVSSGGDVTVTNDGATILQEMDIEHPAARMMVEVARAQDAEAGDGTTTAVVLAGELLGRAEDLLDQDIHATVIADGYRQAAERARECLQECAVGVSLDDRAMLERIACSSLTGKSAEVARDRLIDLVVRAVPMVIDEDGILDPANVRIRKRAGESVDDTALIGGLVIDKERAHPRMPDRVEDAGILLLNAPLEVRKTEIESGIRVTRPEQLQTFLEQEERTVRRMVDVAAASGADVIFCQKGISDTAQDQLARAGILAVRRVKKSDMDGLVRATGGSLVTSIDDIAERDLGYAGLVEEREVGGERLIFVEKCRNPGTVTLLVRGGTVHVVDEIERVLHDAVEAVADAIEDGRIVAGGGAPEMEIAARLRDHAASIGGRAQLAINAFADSMEIIPRTLAENAGLDPIDMLDELRSAHERGERMAGLNVDEGRPGDMLEEGVVDPLRVKVQAIASAAEAAAMILQIDDVIATRREGGGGMPSEGLEQ